MNEPRVGLGSVGWVGLGWVGITSAIDLITLCVPRCLFVQLLSLSISISFSLSFLPIRTHDCHLSLSPSFSLPSLSVSHSLSSTSYLRFALPSVSFSSSFIDIFLSRMLLFYIFFFFLLTATIAAHYLSLFQTTLGPPRRYHRLLRRHQPLRYSFYLPTRSSPHAYGDACVRGCVHTRVTRPRTRRR